MQKVLLVGPLLSTGGVTRYVKDLMSWSGDYKYVLFNVARPIKEKIKPVIGYKEIFNAGLLRTIIGILFTLKNLFIFPIRLLFSGVDIVHICGVSFWPFWENSFYIIISKMFGYPVIIHYLGAFDLFYLDCSKFQQKLIRAILRLPDRIILLSNKVQSLVTEFIEIDRTLVIPSNVDTLKYMNLHEDRSQSDGKFNVLFIGGVDPFRKGVYDIIEVAKLIKKEGINDVKFLISGGESLEAVKELCKENELNSLIDFIGWIPEKEKIKILHSSNVFVLPSYNEGLPYAVVEAMAAGLPIVASNVGGIPEVVIQGENGYIIEPGDVRSLTNYIILLFKNKDLCSEIREKNLERTRLFYSKDMALEKLDKVFGEVLKAGSSKSF